MIEVYPLVGLIRRKMFVQPGEALLVWSKNASAAPVVKLSSEHDADDWLFVSDRAVVPSRETIVLFK